LVDRNVRSITEAEWQWADIVILSAMIVQKDDLLSLIKEAKRRGKKVACGGPYPTSMPEDPQAAGVDYLILDEGEITLPMFVEAIAKGEPSGIFRTSEKPDEDSLQMTKKFQNTRSSLLDSVEAITKTGIRVMAGFIIGFDGEKKGAGDRIVRFTELTGIPTITFAMLQALPHTALWYRLDKEGRLRTQNGNLNQTTLMNFEPTRPVEEIAREYVEAFWTLYEPHDYLDLVYSYFLKLGAPKVKVAAKLPSLLDLKALAIIVWRQGLKRDTRFKFWHHLFSMIKKNPAVWEHYLIVCAHNEHFMEYRDIVRSEIEGQLADYWKEEERMKKLDKVAA